MNPKINSPCPCGSGRKYKHCCGGKPNTMPRGGTAAGLPVGMRHQTGTPRSNRRPCDGCTACCTALTINDPDLVLADGKPCPRLCASGCSIYGESMPETCKGYLCNYVLEPGKLTVNERPDHVGAIVRLERNRTMPLPLNRVTYVNECAAGGVLKTLENRVWGRVIRRDLLAGHPLLVSRIEDPQDREVLHVRYFKGRLGCELTSCHSDASPILKTMEPVHTKPIRLALVIPKQGFAFDARVLIGQLGDREFIVLGSSKTAATDLHFLFTRRQAEVFEALYALMPAVLSKA
ncbi:MAG: SEC-C domain-containing protein [Phycisphaerae bacterium]|nr:SEC-C domain-containing protein [Phycisphaerae bacterium]